MAFRIHQMIQRGEIDNTQKGWVKGRLWVVGREAPYELRLRGNCARDIAGCMLSFDNPEPEGGVVDGLSTVQNGVVGDMTASRKARIPTVTQAELRALILARLPIPSRLGNALYLEWFSSENGRVVIESAHYHVTVSEPAWSMSAVEELEQQKENARALAEFMRRLIDGVGGAGE